MGGSPKSSPLFSATSVSLDIIKGFVEPKLLHIWYAWTERCKLSSLCERLGAAHRMTRPSREFDISPQRLRHIRWIGGGNGAGKATRPPPPAGEQGFCLYPSDDTQTPPTAP